MRDEHPKHPVSRTRTGVKRAREPSFRSGCESVLVAGCNVVQKAFNSPVTRSSGSRP